MDKIEVFSDGTVHLNGVPLTSAVSMDIHREVNSTLDVDLHLAQVEFFQYNHPPPKQPVGDGVERWILVE